MSRSDVIETTTLTPSKRCFKCGTEQPVENFYRHAQMADGRLNKCKLCARADVIANRASRAEYYRAYENRRATIPSRIEAQRAYAVRYTRTHPLKKAAHTATGNAIRDGRLARRPCEVCGCPEVEAHHDDYLKPLTVRWLCRRDHTAWHKRLRVA